MEGTDLVKAVTCAAPHEWLDRRRRGRRMSSACRRSGARRARLRIAAYDFGHQAEHPAAPRARTTATSRVFPASAPAADLLAIEPDGMFLSNGPGDPAAVPYAIDNVTDAGRRRRADVRDLPRATRCWAWRWAASTYKLKFGHRGGNHPVKNLDTGQGRDHVAEPRLCRGSRLAAEPRARHAPESVRRHGRRPPPHGQARLLRAVSSRSIARPARCGLPLSAVPGRD